MKAIMSVVMLIWVTPDGESHQATRTYPEPCSVMEIEMEWWTQYAVEIGAHQSSKFFCADIRELK